MAAYPAPATALTSELPGLLSRAFRKAQLHRGMAIGLLIVAALIGFEVFNFGTTQFALADLIGDLQFAGISWAVILALAFCAIDFAGLVRLFTPAGDRQAAAEVWYLVGAWLVAAIMNAILTWWGVSIALLGHQSLGRDLFGEGALQKFAPVFVAVLVWVLRVLVIGAVSLSGRRIFSLDEPRPSKRLRFSGPGSTSSPAAPSLRPAAALGRSPLQAPSVSAAPRGPG